MRRVARLCVVFCLAAHGLALAVSGADAASTPISQLSRGAMAWLHSAGLLALALAWVLIATECARHREGRLWRLGWILMLVSAAVLPYLAYYFATASDAVLSGPDANDPLGILACLLGVAMGALQPGLRRQSAVLAGVNLLVLGLWIALVPVIPFLEPQWLGAYERTVGLLLLLWTLALSFLPAG